MHIYKIKFIRKNGSKETVYTAADNMFQALNAVYEVYRHGSITVTCVELSDD